MIYTFRVVSDEMDNFRRDIQIDADNTFLDLKNAICNSVNYDKNQMCSFFICESNWEKTKEITLEDMGFDSADEVYLMDDSIISDFVEDKGQRLLFTFDYMTDRSLFMELKEIIVGKNLLEPVCTHAIGNAPAQNVDLDDFEAKTDARAAAIEDFDEDFYGEEGYNEDEFEGFDEMTFED